MLDFGVGGLNAPRSTIIDFHCSWLVEHRAEIFESVGLELWCSADVYVWRAEMSWCGRLTIEWLDLDRDKGASKGALFWRVGVYNGSFLLCEASCAC